MANSDLKYQFARLNIAEKLIAINVAVFLLNGIGTYLLQVPNDFVMRWFVLP